MQSFTILALAALSTIVSAVPHADSCTIKCGDCVGITGCSSGSAAHFDIVSGLGTVCKGEQCILGTDFVKLSDGEFKVETRSAPEHCDIKCGGCMGLEGCPATSSTFFSITDNGLTCKGEKCLLGTDLVKLQDGEIEVQTRDVEASVKLEDGEVEVQTRGVEASGDHCSVKCGDCVGISMLCGASANIDIVNGLATCGGEHCTMSVPTTLSVAGVTVTL